jgi:hypothetical protein
VVVTQSLQLACGLQATELPLLFSVYKDNFTFLRVSYSYQTLIAQLVNGAVFMQSVGRADKHMSCYAYSIKLLDWAIAISRRKSFRNYICPNVTVGSDLSPATLKRLRMRCETGRHPRLINIFTSKYSEL